MPGMSGLELLKRIRADDPEVPVIMITAFGTIQNAVEAVKSGAYDYLTKPIDYEDLAARGQTCSRSYASDAGSPYSAAEP